jgi:hypothetical protein
MDYACENVPLSVDGGSMMRNNTDPPLTLGMTFLPRKSAKQNSQWFLTLIPQTKQWYKIVIDLNGGWEGCSQLEIILQKVFQILSVKIYQLGTHLGHRESKPCWFVDLDHRVLTPPPSSKHSEGGRNHSKEYCGWRVLFRRGSLETQTTFDSWICHEQLLKKVYNPTVTARSRQ